jgi:hypothetical protein
VTYFLRFAPLAPILCILLAAAPLAQQAEPVHPGHPSLDTTPIRVSTDSMAVYVVDEGQMVPVGRFLIDTIVEEDVITRTERFYGALGELAWTETLVVEDHTLRPVSHSVTGIRNEAVNFERSAVVLTRTVEDEARTTTAEMDAPVFLTKMIDLVLASLPLTEGFAATLLVLDEMNLRAHEVPVSVIRATNVQEVGGTVRPTWEVSVDIDGATDLYHVDRQTGQLVRYESSADGVVILRW